MTLRISSLLALLLLILPAADAARTQTHKTPPDLTKGGKPDGTRDWALGPIGANGWVFNQRPQKGASALARQILITRVEQGAPADGKLLVDDVITGVSGQPINYDARKVLAAAINEAEKEKNQGRLALTVWRGGTEQEVVLTLPVLGSYSKTAPFDCEKTDRIIDQASEYMKTREIKPGWIGWIDGLGMLATGREDLMPQIRKLAAESYAKPDESFSVEKHISMKCWNWSYRTVFPLRVLPCNRRRGRAADHPGAGQCLGDGAERGRNLGPHLRGHRERRLPAWTARRLRRHQSDGHHDADSADPCRRVRCHER